MRYTERNYNKEKQEDSPELLKNVAEIIEGPYVFVKEISRKFPFLKRSTIEIVLVVAILIGVAEITIDSTIRVVLGEFDLYNGRLPLVVRLVAVGILVLLYILYEIIDFRIYKSVDQLLPLQHFEGEEESVSDLKETFPDVFEDDKPVANSRTTGDADKDDSNELTLDDLSYNGTKDEIIEELDIDLAMLDDEMSSKYGDKPVELGEEIKYHGIRSDSKPVSLKKEDTSAEDEDHSIPSLAGCQEVLDYQNKNEKIASDINEKGTEYTGSMSADEIAALEYQIAMADKNIHDDLQSILETEIEDDDYTSMEVLKDWGVPSYFSMIV